MRDGVFYFGGCKVRGQGWGVLVCLGCFCRSFVRLGRIFVRLFIYLDLFWRRSVLLKGLVLQIRGFCGLGFSFRAFIRFLFELFSSIRVMTRISFRITVFVQLGLSVRSLDGKKNGFRWRVSFFRLVIGLRAFVQS